MCTQFQRVLILLLFLFSGVGNTVAAEKQNTTLVGWGIDRKNTEKFFADAADVGFDALITWSTDPVFLENAVNAGTNYNIKVFSSITPMGAMAALWKRQYPQDTFPWQMMDENENAAFKFLSAERNRYLVPYQFGGEPCMAHEVLLNKIVCFSSMEGRELFKPIIDGIASVPGIAGIAFDGFGYQNYHSCHCARCQKELGEYRKQHPEISETEADSIYFRGILVDYINHLANYARSKKKDIKTTIHIWPVFAPEPLYGNCLDLDFCGQTAAWFTLWPKEKIAQYSKLISEQAKQYHQRQQGVAMVGYYDRPGEFLKRLRHVSIWS